MKTAQGKTALGDGLLYSEHFKNVDTKNKKGWLSKEGIQYALK